MWPLIRSLDFHLREQTTFCLYNFFFKKKIVPRISSFDFHFRGRTTFCDIILLLKKRYYQKFSIADDLLASHLKKRPLIFFLQTTFLASNFWSRWHQNLIFPSHFLFLLVICHFFWKRKKKHRALRVVRRCSSLAYAKCSTSIPADSIDRLVAAWLTAAGCWKKKERKMTKKWRKQCHPPDGTMTCGRVTLILKKKIIEFDKMFLFQVLSFHKETRFNFLLLCTSES